MNTGLPSVSVCMITYNHEEFIIKAIKGVLMQQIDYDFELIITNDASNDKTHNIIHDFILNHSKKNVIKYVNHANNIGMMQNFIFALQECKGKYIALCEGDDYWTDPLKLQKQVDFLEANKDFNICFHNVSIYNQSTNEIEEDTLTRDVSETTSVIDLVDGNFMHTPSVVFRNDFKIPHWFKKSPLGDWPLYMIIIKDGKIKRINDMMAVYRVHGDSLWSSKSQKERNLNTYFSMRLIYKYVALPIEAKQILKNKLLTSKKVHSKYYRLKKGLINKIIRFK